MSKQPRVGDTVSVSVRINRITEAGNIFYGEIVGSGKRVVSVRPDEVTEIVQFAPIKVGDIVHHGSCTLPRTVLAIQQDPERPDVRSWGVIAYKTDIPQVVKLSELRRHA
jgi:hypothetical protein